MMLKRFILTILILIILVHSSTGNNVTDSEQTDEIKVITASETELITLNVSASDPDKEDILIYFFSSPFDDKGIWQPGYEDAGEYIVNITVSDGEFTDNTQVKVIVLEKDRAPIIIATGSQQINEDEALILPIEAFDPDNDEVTLSAIDLPENASFINNTLYWRPNYDVVEKSLLRKILARLSLDFLKDKKQFTATINAKGKDLGSTATITIEVIDNNRAPTLNQLDNITIKEGGILHLSPEANDPDNDSLVFYYDGFANMNNYLTDYDDSGLHTIIVTVSDGFLTDSKTVNVTVENTNRYPELTKFKGYEVNENEQISFDVNAFDPDGDALSFDIRPFPDGATFDNKTFSWTPNFDTVTTEELSKTFNLNITTYDGQNSDTKQTTITVNHVNRVPEILSQDPETEEFAVFVGSSVVFEVNASDPDNDTLSYNWNFGLLSAYDGPSIHKRVFMRTGKKTITATVSDGFTTTEKVWKLNVVRQSIPQEEQVIKKTEVEYISFTI
ncbi:PKD domain-containing protein [Candidatus Woesearchaeota archaeon]|jgi:PKD repeat protein|nr:PKD domain-containing protein [Candidatus Woesearchaeota archaeon]